ncbi:endolytic transglycosylase MltG [Catenulispora acidiphila]|uniref:endolytic transglycosylase MltG n=1 Tax=Catenulispora acidiphila TaxID=304895 RepID=UPI0003030C23|nr:endolytic transglycosylase MltG [Catenulispora acidiphila]
MGSPEGGKTGTGYAVPGENGADDGYEDPPPTRRDRLKAWGPLLVPVVVFGGIAAFVFAGIADMARTSHAPDYSASSCSPSDPHKVLVEVNTGATGKAIGDALFNAGVVRSTQAFVDAAGHNEAARGISTGTYRVCPKISAATAITELLNSANLSPDSLLEVRPGDYSWETLQALAKKREWSKDDLQQLIDTNQIGLPPWSKSADGHWTAEGMLEPGRYTLTSADTPQSVLTSMVRTRVAELTALGLPAKAAMLKCAPARACTPEEALTIASLAEAEVTKPDPDGREVSEAVQNRLSRGDFVGVDATTRYWMSLLAGKRVPVTAREVTDPTDPYATGGHKGLPPTPVSIPSKQMIAAVLTPATERWYYWCASGDGTKFFKESEKTQFEQTCLTH